jgi:hypothetical protein
MLWMVGVAADPGATITPHGVCERAAAPAATCSAQVLVAMLRTRLARASSRRRRLVCILTAAVTGFT